MKLPTKPISSPGRPDKFPPPLMRFLRNNEGSRSRGRSKSNTIFLRKKIEAPQEPSSPKVTCMGQVRVKRSSAGAGAPAKCPCFRWVPLFFHRLVKPISRHHCHFQPSFPNWGFLKRRKTSPLRKTELKFRGSEINFQPPEQEERVNVSALVSDEATPPQLPPRNALLLTRCRSAPYRSSSLASRFWSEETGVGNRVLMETGEENRVLLETVEENRAFYKTGERNRVFTETGEENRVFFETGEGNKVTIESGEENRVPIETGEENIILSQTGEKNRVPTENERPTSERNRDGKRRDPKFEEKLRFFKELEDSLREKIMESEKVLRRREETGESVFGPLVLTRCKSEPARTGKNLDPEVNGFLKKTRLGLVDTWFPYGL